MDNSRKESIAILSRKQWLDKKHLNMIRSRIRSMQIKPRDLSIISLYYCPKYMREADRLRKSSYVEQFTHVSQLHAPQNIPIRFVKVVG